MSPSSPTINPENAFRAGRLLLPAAALLLGILVRVLHLLEFRSLPLFDFPAGPDVSEYWNEARAIAFGAGLPREASIHGPLYPCFLALLIRVSGGSMFVVRLLQSLLGLAAAIPFFLVLRDSFSERRGSFRFVPAVFLFFYALWPPLVAFQAEFFSENAALLALSGAAWFFASFFSAPTRGRRTAAAIGVGLCGGLAALAHPSSLAFPFLCGLVLLCRRNFAACALLASALILTIAPASLRNSRFEGRFVPIQKNSMFNLWLGNSEESVGLCRIPPGDEWQEVHARPEMRAMSHDQYFLSETLRFFLERPFSAAANLMRKFQLAFHTEELTTWSDASPLGLLFLHRVGFRWFAFPGALALAALLIFLPARGFRRDMLPFLLLLAAGWAAQTLFVAAGRYRIPMLPAVFALASFLICSLPFLFRNKKRVLRAAAALAASLLFILAAVPRRDAELERDYARTCLAESYAMSGNKIRAEEILAPLLKTWTRDSRVSCLIGGLRLERGDVDGAAEAAELALSQSPGKPDPMILSGRVLAARGNYPAAQNAYRDALAVSSGETRAAICFYSGELARMRGDARTATDCYESALSLCPTMAEAWNNLGVLKADDPLQALKCFEMAHRLAPTEDHAWNLDAMRQALERGPQPNSNASSESEPQAPDSDR